MKSQFYIFAVAAIISAVFSGCKKEKPVAPTVVTKSASGIAESRVTLNAEITNEGSDAVTSCGFYYNTTPDMSYPEVVMASVGDRAFSVNITNLQPETTYYYMAFAKNNAGISEGEIRQFTTPISFTEGTLRWYRLGNTKEGLDKFGLYWHSNTKDIMANIEPIEGARLFLLEPDDYELTSAVNVKEKLVAANEITRYREISVTVASKTYNTVLATTYNDKTFLLHITSSTCESTMSGIAVTVNGSYKQFSN